MTRKMKTFSKKDVCEIPDEVLASEIEVINVENSTVSIVTFRGLSYVVKSGSKADIIKSIKSQCSCPCGSEIKL